MLLKMDIVNMTYLTLVSLKILTAELFKNYIIFIMEMLP